jgi:single-strand DNA-binding protein
LAEVAEKYIRKGTKIYVEGKLKRRSWQDKEGNNRFTTEIIGDDLTILSRSEHQERIQHAYTNEGRPAQPTPMVDLSTGSDDNVPF